MTKFAPQGRNPCRAVPGQVRPAPPPPPGPAGPATSVPSTIHWEELLQYEKI